MMTRTPGGHCHVNVADWTGKQPITISAAAARGYGVSQDALQIKRATPSEAIGTRVYQTAASAIQRAYCSWRNPSTASSAAIRNQVQSSFRGQHVGQSRKESDQRSGAMAAFGPGRSLARTYLFLAAAAAGLHWATHCAERDSTSTGSKCKLFPSTTEEGSKSTRAVDHVHGLQGAPNLHFPQQGLD
eukprot:4586263-Amphidinium_carterae.1